MKANEFRIGNFAQDQDGNLLKVIGLQTDPESINEDVISFYVVDRTKFPLKKGYSAKPIPLTEDWLIKLGFNKNGCIFIHKSKHIIECDFDKQIFMYYFFEEGDWYNIINHVHELQNLYFALTGNELTIEL